MKKLPLLAAILFSGAILPSFGQKIFLKIDNVTPLAGEEIKALEWNVEAASSYTSGGGASVGKPNPGTLRFKYGHGKSSDLLFRNLVKGTAIPKVVVEYFDVVDPKAPYYTLTFTEVFITQVSFLSPECPTCIKLDHQVGMVFKTAELKDAINGTTTKWDIAALTVTTQ